MKCKLRLQSERVQQVKYGSTLEENLIENRAQLLEAKQELLTTYIQLSDLHPSKRRDHPRLRPDT